MRFLVFLLREEWWWSNEQMNAHSGAMSSLSESHLHGWNGRWCAFFLLGLLGLLGTNENGEISSSLMSGIVYVYVYYIMHAFISLQSFHINTTTK